MTREEILTIIQGGHLTDGDLADALLAELAKVQEPFGYYENGRWSIVTDGGPDKWRARKEYTGPLYTHPAPSVPTQVTCQLYGHVVGACDECNTHTEKDVNETNKRLADNYLKLTCGIAPSVPEVNYFDAQRISPP